MMTKEPSQTSVSPGESMPASYYRSPLFLGTYAAVAVSLASGVASFGLASPLLATINQDIGPSPDIDWVSYVYNLVLACSLCLVGRLGDIFGRRWFFITGNFLALIGTIIAATSVNVPMLIVGMAVTSLGSSTQLSFQYVMGELVPVGKRFIVMSSLFVWTLPLGGFGPIISTSFQNHTGLHWRWCFWLCAILNFVSTLQYMLFYHPPGFRRMESTKSKSQAFRELDWVGIFLFSSGFFIYLIGLNWGGNRYEWKSAAVLCTVLLGATELLIFIAWEASEIPKIPYFPIRLFKNLRWVAMTVCLGVGACQYYALAIIWPKMLVALWPEKATGDNYGWLSVTTGLTLIIGQIAGSFVANWVDNKKILLILSTSVGTATLAATACSNANNLSTALGLIITAFLSLGVQEAVSGVFCTVALKDQADIGVGGGVATTMRAGLSALGSVIYNAVLTSRLSKTIPDLVSKAASRSGLPSGSIANLIALLKGQGSQEDVMALTPKILDEATVAYQKANALAYRDVMLTTLAFGAISIFCAFFTPEIDKTKSKEVSRVLEKEKGGQVDV